MSFSFQKHGYPTEKFLSGIETQCEEMAKNNNEADAIRAIPPLVRAAIGEGTGIEHPVTVESNGHKSGTWSSDGKSAGQAIFLTLTIKSLAPFEPRESD